MLPEGSDVRAVAWTDPLEVDLEDLRPTRVSTGTLHVELATAPPEVPDGALPGPLAVLAAARSTLVELMRDGASASALDLGHGAIERLAIEVGGVPVADFRAVGFDGASGALDLRADGLNLAGVDGGLESLDAHFTTSTGAASAGLVVQTSLLGVTVGRAVRVTLRGDALDTPSPTMDYTFGFE